MTKIASPRRRPPAAAGAERELRIPFGWAALVLFVLSFVYFLPAFLPDRGIYGTDYLAATYVFHDFVSQRFAAGELPTWVPYVFGGVPLFANPGSTFHPVHVLGDLLLPTSRILPFVFVVQFWLAGIGMYLLARELRCRPWVAFVAALAFQFTGTTLSWVYAGHDGRIMVATMTPLFFFFLHRGVRTAAPAPFAGAAATLALALLSFQIQNAYYLLLAGAIWGVFLLVRFRSGRKPATLAGIAGMALAAVALAFVIAAVNFLPFLSYVPESPRGDAGGRGYEYSVSFSMPPADVIGMAVPEQSGATVHRIDRHTGQAVAPLFPPYTGPNPIKLNTEYVGALVLLLLVLGAFHARRDPYWLFFAALAAFALSLALGGHTPLYRFYYEVLPGLKRFRAPDLAFYVTAFSLVTMAALTLERLAALRDGAHGRSQARAADGGASGAVVWIVAGVLGVSMLGAFLAWAGGADPVGSPSRALGWLRFALFAAATGAVLWAWTQARLTTTVAALALSLVTVADLWVIGQRFFQTAPPVEALHGPDDVATFLLEQPQPARVWNYPGFPYRGRDDSYLMHFGIEMAGGEHGNPLQRWNEYVGAGEGLRPRTWVNFLDRRAFLDAANVRWVLIALELDEPWLREAYRGRAGIVYENLTALPRAYLVPSAVAVSGATGALQPMTSGEWDPRETAYVQAPAPLGLPDEPLDGAVEMVTHEPDRVVVRTQANRPALLVLADNMYPGWEAAIGGEPAEILLTNHTFRGVIVPAGAHTVEFTFRPRPLYAGLYLSIAGWALLVLSGVWLLIRRLRRRPPRTQAAT
jgi:hypothetical protein